MKDCSSSSGENTDLTSSENYYSDINEYQSSYNLDLRETFKLKVIINFHVKLSIEKQTSVMLQALQCLREDCPEYSLSYSSPNDYFVDPTAEELVKNFYEYF